MSIRAQSCLNVSLSSLRSLIPFSIRQTMSSSKMILGAIVNLNPLLKMLFSPSLSVWFDRLIAFLEVVSFLILLASPLVPLISPFIPHISLLLSPSLFIPLFSQLIPHVSLLLLASILIPLFSLLPPRITLLPYEYHIFSSPQASQNFFAIFP